MLGTLVKVAIVAAVVALVIDSLPDIKRYLKIRDMLGLATLRNGYVT
jgi:hypothetical protein